MIDTGADITTVSPSVMRKLGLVSLDSQNIRTAAGTARCDVYEVSLTFADHEFPSCLVLESRQEFRTHGILIGRDILNEAVFHYDGPRGRFTLRFD
jgi:predicted aspartyl protease